MDDELLQLEAELKRLRPVEPSRSLAAGVERDLSQPPGRRPVVSIYWLWAAALPAAAAIAIGVVQFSRRSESSPALSATAPSMPMVPAAAGNDKAPFKPIAAENVLVAASDEGLVTLEDGTQARRERRHYVDTITWKNPRTNASLRWSVPREEVRVVPIAFQ